MSKNPRPRSLNKSGKERTTPPFLTELERLWSSLRFPQMEDRKYTGVNKYCVTCKKGNARKILACRQDWCEWFGERYTYEMLEEEKKEEAAP